MIQRSDYCSVKSVASSPQHEGWAVSTCQFSHVHRELQSWCPSSTTVALVFWGEIGSSDISASTQPLFITIESGPNTTRSPMKPVVRLEQALVIIEVTTRRNPIRSPTVYPSHNSLIGRLEPAGNTKHGSSRHGSLFLLIRVLLFSCSVPGHDTATENIRARGVVDGKVSTNRPGQSLFQIAVDVGSICRNQCCGLGE